LDKRGGSRAVKNGGGALAAFRHRCCSMPACVTLWLIGRAASFPIFPIAFEPIDRQSDK
jgi:hypothetical protein